MEFEYMNLKKMAEYTGIPYSTLKAYKRKDPDFPGSFMLTKRKIFYRKDEIDAYFAAKRKIAGA